MSLEMLKIWKIQSGVSDSHFLLELCTESTEFTIIGTTSN